MIKRCCSLIVLLLFVYTPVCAAELPSAPALGSIYKIDKASYKVVGAGTEEFEYTSTGESLEIKILNKVPGTMVITPEKGELVKVDPSKPMVWVANKPHKEFLNNSYLKRTAKGKPFLLLEYIR